MDKLILLFYLLLSLTGCQPTQTMVTHELDNGVEQIYSKIQISPELATFRCLRSRSGVCHYTLLERSCSNQRVNCDTPITVFTMRQGDTRLLSQLPDDFAACVSAEAMPDQACA